MGASQILDVVPYDQMAASPKIICGYSDVAYLCNAVLARSRVMTYYGPNFTTFMMRRGAEYILERFRECLFTDTPFELRPASHWSDDAWHNDQENRTFHDNEGFWSMQEGEAEGTLVGGSYYYLCLEYMNTRS